MSETISKPLSITDKIKTFEDALAAKGMDYSDFEKYCGTRKYSIAFEKLIIISSVLNESWTPDYENSKEQRWNPYFELKAPFAFKYCEFIDSPAGSRLCYKTKELAKYAA